MSLETIIQIGKILRQSKNPMRHFRFVHDVPEEMEDKHVICLTIPVDAQNHICFNQARLSTEIEREKFCYLSYKTSNQDRSPSKYIFGDILYEVRSKIIGKGSNIQIEETGNYILAKSEAFDNIGHRTTRIQRYGAKKGLNCLYSAS